MSAWAAVAARLAVAVVISVVGHSPKFASSRTGVDFPTPGMPVSNTRTNNEQVVRPPARLRPSCAPDRIPDRQGRARGRGSREDRTCGASTACVPTSALRNGGTVNHSRRFQLTAARPVRLSSRRLADTPPQYHLDSAGGPPHRGLAGAGPRRRDVAADRVELTAARDA